MKITKENLRRIIREEINEMTDMDMASKLSRLLDSQDEAMIMTGIDVATSIGMPIIIRNPPYQILKFIESADDPDLLTLLAQPETHKKIQARIARNQNTPIEVIYKIATDMDYNIRAANYAKQSLEIYCSQDPEHKFCKSIAIDTRYRQ